jgi:hypothetical protein
MSTNCKVGSPSVDKGYALYPVSTNTTDAATFKGDHFVVHRRYSDFVSFLDILLAKFPFAGLPRLPEKRTVKNLDEKVLEQRRRQMGRFLTRLCRIPVISSIPAFVAFCTKDVFHSALYWDGKNDAKEDGAKPSRSIVKWLEAIVQSITGPITALPGQSEEVHVNAHAKFEDVAAHFTELEGALVMLAGAIVYLSSKMRDEADLMFEVGQSFLWLSQGEGGLLGAALETTHIFNEISLAAFRRTEGLARRVEEPIAEYASLVRSARSSLRRYQTVRNAYISSLQKLDAEMTVHHKMMTKERNGKAVSLDASKAHKVVLDKACTEADALQKKAEAAAEQFISNLHRFHKEKVADFLQVITDYLNSEACCSSVCTSAWKTADKTVDELHKGSMDILPIPKGFRSVPGGGWQVSSDEEDADEEENDDTMEQTK